MLSTDKIKDLLSHGENKQVEFKKCTDKVSASVYETVCSFLNAEGGYIFLGVDDDGTILGINPKCVTDMTKSIINTLNNPEQFLPPMPITPEQTEIDGKIILYLNVPESEQVHRYKNRFFDRWGDADNDVSKHTYLVKNMFMRKEKESSENEVFPDVTLEDMDEESFKIMRSHISIHNSNHPWLSMTNEEFLKSLFWGKQRGTNREGYKLAAILLFGREQTILNCCPWHRTDAIYRSISYERFLHPLPTDPDIRYNDRDMICVNLIQSYIRLLNFVQRNMPDKFRLADNGIDRLDLRVMIFREVISNTLLHREYISSYTNKFLIFRDRVITENWTKPFQTGDIDINDWRTRTKNPLITKVFREMKWAEELGSGQKNIRKYAPLYFENSEIEIHSGEEFVFSITYRDPKEFEFAENIPTSHRQVGTKSALSWQQVGTKVALSQKEIKTILEACLLENSLTQIIALFNFSDRTKFKRKYINPLIAEGLLAMTVPDKPNSRLQKYYTTEKGKSLLLCQDGSN